MNLVTILLIFVLFYINNTYASLVGEEEKEDILSSHDKFEELVMTSTIPPESFPTNTIVTTTESNNLPVQTNVESIPMKETIVTAYYKNNIWHFVPITTTLPIDVDDVKIPCSYIDYYKLLTESTLSPYACDENMNCYTLHENYNYTLDFSFYTDLYNCNFYTKRNNDPMPTESIEMTEFCPTTTLTTYYRSILKQNHKTDINERNRIVKNTFIYTVLTDVYPDRIMCDFPATTATTTSYEHTETLNIRVQETPDLESIKNKNNFIFQQYFNSADSNKLYITRFQFAPMTIPSDVNKYAVDCGFQFETYQPPPSSTTTTTTTISAKKLPSGISMIYENDYRIIPTNIPKERSNIERYCENDDNCFKLYTTFTTRYKYHPNINTLANCAIYTQITDEPFYSTAVRTIIL
ncbi:hypothetical protein PIROE2DRAFT_8836 [Piromyces sp. E2]|nr:hypothetical protein PIROE2DRAFT_8836 [Piromyces sp. E2]|eukprot:OUM64365.1 hypothetical protein PIROE2DRAFT_8836 [Piromyces sp. E2]